MFSERAVSIRILQFACPSNYLDWSNTTGGLKNPAQLHLGVSLPCYFKAILCDHMHTPGHQGRVEGMSSSASQISLRQSRSLDLGSSTTCPGTSLPAGGEGTRGREYDRRKRERNEYCSNLSVILEHTNHEYTNVHAYIVCCAYLFSTQHYIIHGVYICRR